MFVISHSNAPQVGNDSYNMNEFKGRRRLCTGTDVCLLCDKGQVMSDWILQNAIRAELLKRGVYRPCMYNHYTVMVDPYDDAFTELSKGDRKTPFQRGSRTGRETW